MNEIIRSNVEISIVIPVYNAEKSLSELHNRLTSTLENLLGSQNYEIIFIDDFSKDDSYEVMKKIHAKDEKVKLVRLMRNFGQHNAIMCGFRYSTGKYVVTMDDDLQNPPEEIPRLYNSIKYSNVDCVIGKPAEKKHKKYRNFGSYGTGLMYQIIFKKNKNLKMGSFRILDRQIVSRILEEKSPNPMIGAYILKNTLNIINVDIQHNERKYGASNYSLVQLIKLSFDLIINYSTIPLSFLSIIGLFFSLIGIFAATYIVASHFLGNHTIAGWASTISAILLFNGLVLFSFGIMGQYLIRILQEIKEEDQYAVREVIF